MNELSWKNNQGLTLYARHWPVANPKAVIALTHGQGEHIGRYDHLAAWYNQHQVAVIGFDHQGYGRSEGKRGHAKNLEVLLDDIGLLLQKAKELYPETPLYLYGHSMGGGLALHFVMRRDPAIAGLIATGPWIRLAFEAPAIKVLAGRIMCRIFPALSLPTGLATEYLSHDPAVVNAYNNDPLVHDKLSAAAGIALLEGARFVNAWSGKFNVPVLIQHGGADKITSAPASKELSQRAQGNITYREWPGLYHEIHNEKEQLEVFAFTLNWMFQ